jgi:hypothetical protein
MKTLQALGCTEENADPTQQTDPESIPYLPTFLQELVA